MAAAINVTMSDIGHNIRAIRKSRGYTQEELAYQISLVSGVRHSHNLIGYWERGEKRPNPVELFHIAQALRTSIESLYLYEYTNSQDLDLMAVSKAFRNLAIEDQRILAYSLLQFEGDTHAMVQAVGMYCGMYNADREVVIGEEVIAYKSAMVAGHLRPEAPVCDIDYVESQWERLLHCK